MAYGAWKKNLVILWGAQFIGMSAITGVISFLPLYVRHLGITGTEQAAMWSGFVIGAAAFFAALSNPYWGALADRKGCKPLVEKVLLLFGIIIIAMACITNVYQLLALRILQGCCGGFTAATAGLAVRMSPEKQIPSTLGILQSSLIVGGAAGPMIGGIIADSFGFRQPFILFGTLCLIALLVIHFAVKENFVPAARPAKIKLQETFQYIWSFSEMRLVLLVQFLASFAIYCIAPILPLYIQRMAYGNANLAGISGTVIAVAGLSSALASASAGLLNKRFSNQQILFTASLLGGISFAGQLGADNLVTLTILRAVNGLCIGAMIPTANIMVAALIPESKRNTAYGITNGVSLMGNVLGPILAGVLSMAWGLTAVFWVAGGLFLVVSALLLTDFLKSALAGSHHSPARGFWESLSTSSHHGN